MRHGSALGSASRGALAGLGGTVVQTLLGLAIDKLLLPRGHDNNIAPRLVNRLFRWTGHRDDPARDWTLGTVFHVGYGLGWGALYGLVRRWTGLPAAALGPAFGGVIYLLAFSRVGGGTLTWTERPPLLRPRWKQASLIAVGLTYALTTAVLTDRIEDATDGGSAQP